MSTPPSTDEIATRMRDIEREILARAPEHDVQPSLDRVARAMELLGDPQRAFRVIHLTGTNGKTSTTRVIEALCRELGLTTGRFTSPHLHTIRERIAVGGEPLSPERFVEVWDQVSPYIAVVDAESTAQGGPWMTYFEVVVVLAYAAFADAPVDVAVVEVGMGGRWDATNVADGDVAVITPVDLDHMHFLGPDIESIAGEKSGIIKPGAIVVSADQVEVARDILTERAESVGARILFQDKDFGLTEREVALGGQRITVSGLAANYADLFLPLHGAHQAQNATLAIAAVEAFVGGGATALSGEVVEAGLLEATSPGRLEVVRRSPTVLVDAAHNPHGARALAEALEEAFAFTRLVGVLAVMSDKDATALLEALEPVLDEVVVTRSSSPRSMRPEQLAELAREVFGEHRVTVARDLPEAIDRAATLAEDEGIGGGVVATGSVVTAADVRMLFHADGSR